MKEELEEYKMKSYVKPAIYYESFELTHHIASCTIEMNSAIETCTNGKLVQDGFTYYLFDAGMEGCKQYDNGMEIYCYTNMTWKATDFGFGS